MLVAPILLSHLEYSFIMPPLMAIPAQRDQITEMVLFTPAMIINFVVYLQPLASLAIHAPMAVNLQPEPPDFLPMVGFQILPIIHCPEFMDVLVIVWQLGHETLFRHFQKLIPRYIGYLNPLDTSPNIN